MIGGQGGIPVVLITRKIVCFTVSRLERGYRRGEDGGRGTAGRFHLANFGRVRRRTIRENQKRKKNGQRKKEE